MADVFVSYSKSHIELTRELAQDLENKGLSVWWDAELVAGESFRQRIIQEIKDCKAAIVIWTPESVQSDFVVSEAERARKDGKLIQVRTDRVRPDDVPPPFDTGHVSLISDRKAIYGALAKLRLLDKQDLPQSSEPLPLYSGRRTSQLWLRTWMSIAALLAVLTIGTSAFLFFKAERPFQSGAASKDTPNPAKLVEQFFNALNAGFVDSSIFDSELRLGRRGNVTAIEAVTALREFLSQHSKVSCRPNLTNLSLKSTELGRSGLRVKVYAMCDFTDKQANATTEHFPLEIEGVPHRGNFVITGLWHSEKMVLWQPRAR